jgi:hypothetical protein
MEKAYMPKRVPVTTLAGASSIVINQEAFKNYEKTLEYLNVENNRRYIAREGKTFCNIYAHDFCEQFGIYLPRVWWNSDALKQIKEGKKPKPEYGKNIFEMNANALYEWLNAGNFGWEKVHPITAQIEVDKGKFGVICARRRDRKKSGHISIILPTSFLPNRNFPIQSQAGAKNYRVFQNSNWFESKLYDAWGAFVI